MIDIERFTPSFHSSFLPPTHPSTYPPTHPSTYPPTMWNEEKEASPGPEGLVYLGLALGRNPPSCFLLPALGRAGKVKAESSSGAYGCPRIFYPTARRLGHISPRDLLCPWRLLPLRYIFLGTREMDVACRTRRISIHMIQERR